VWVYKELQGRGYLTAFGDTAAVIVDLSLAQDHSRYRRWRYNVRVSNEDHG